MHTPVLQVWKLRLIEILGLGPDHWPDGVFRELPKLPSPLLPFPLGMNDLPVDTLHTSVLGHTCPLPYPKRVAEGHQNHDCHNVLLADYLGGGNSNRKFEEPVQASQSF